MLTSYYFSIFLLFPIFIHYSLFIFLLTGYAVITMDNAAVWVDGRYHKQAETELDCNWLIMKYGKHYVRENTHAINSALMF